MTFSKGENYTIRGMRGAVPFWKLIALNAKTANKVLKDISMTNLEGYDQRNVNIVHRKLQGIYMGYR